jgi:hypothetical protein
MVLADFFLKKNTISAKKNKLKSMNYKPAEQPSASAHSLHCTVSTPPSIVSLRRTKQFYHFI